MGAVKDSPKISTLRVSDLTDSLISFDGNVNVWNVSNQTISQNDVDFTKASWDRSFQLLTHITDVDHLTFSLCGSSHHLGPNLSKHFTPNSSQGSKYTTKSKLRVHAFYLRETSGCLLFLVVLCKAPAKEKQKKPTFHLFHFSFFGLSRHMVRSNPTSLLRRSGCTNEATQLSSCLSKGCRS